MEIFYSLTCNTANMPAFITGTGISVLCYTIVKPDTVIFKRIYGYQTKFPLILNCLCDKIEKLQKLFLHGRIYLSSSFTVIVLEKLLLCLFYLSCL